MVPTDGQNEEAVHDFRICRPAHCVPLGIASWIDAQSEYGRHHQKCVQRDALQEYLDELDSVREIYTDEYHIAGRVLDVGGHQGRLRHYLGSDVSLYVSVDPCIDIFSGIGSQPNLLRAYPCLSTPCNFIAAHAEHLPFKSGCFDWVHMRSVVDHFADPYLAFLEAYRCCKPGGKLLVGLSLMEKKPAPNTRRTDTATGLARRITALPARLAAKLTRDGLGGLCGAVAARLCRPGGRTQTTARKDDHMFRLTYAGLMDLFECTGWDVIREHWQKPPFDDCLYVCGQKRSPRPSAGCVAGNASRSRLVRTGLAAPHDSLPLQEALGEGRA